MKRPSKSYEIALSAIACAVAAGALTLGSYVDVMLAAAYLVAVFALMVPLCKDFVWGSALALIGAWLLAFFFCGLSVFHLLPFIAFFGWHPIVNHLQMKYIKKKWVHGVVFLGKAVWFDLAMWLMWATVLVPFFGVGSATWYPFVEQSFFWVLFIGGTLFFAVYDFMIFLCRRSVAVIIARIRR